MCTHATAPSPHIVPLTRTGYHFCFTHTHSRMSREKPRPPLCSAALIIQYLTACVSLMENHLFEVHLFACVCVNHHQVEAGRRDRKSRLINNNLTLYRSPQVYFVRSNSPPQEGRGQIQLGKCRSEANAFSSSYIKSDIFCQVVSHPFLRTH